ncbi:hypothetical protein R2R35_08370 [Anaerocolumna sp. AGMB13020]|uniref:hypothetical protein n=1 Tax=Anaerocolumna sp. AGMB13020 TaxID=3081750 RepID=UPI002953496B|nr:hypothetical protein [Anaerocolumna sp. AGMB13020]WOO38506.1 hypothetical protein R2R35_08370 [Anaerocolumna sp. AGMB13020]
MSNTKIVVLHLKEIIYTVLFAGLGILLIILLVVMFMNKGGDDTDSTTDAKYIPGVYNSTFVLSDTSLNLEVVLDKDHINSIRIVNIDDAVSTFYPLVEPSLEKIAAQLYEGTDIDNIEVTDSSKYTETFLVNAIKATLAKAEISDSTEHSDIQ